MTSTKELTRELEELRQRFKDFRESHAAHSRVPQALRAATVAALHHGVSGAVIRRACRLSGSQLRSWQTAVAPRRPQGSVRVFKVSNATTSLTEGATGARELVRAAAPFEEQTIELRIGPWSVRVGLAGLSARESRG
jgi:hypothetical protein